MRDLMLDAGVPEGVFQVVYSGHDQTELILGDSRVHGVSFTGSRVGGAEVAGIAGRNLKRVSLELGGSDPFVVLSGENLDATVHDALGLRLANAGQICSAPKRFIVADEFYDRFVDSYLTLMDEWDQTRVDPPGGLVQPMASSVAADRLEEQLARAVRPGATLIGARRVGNDFAPGLLVDFRTTPTCTARRSSARSALSTGPATNSGGGDREPHQLRPGLVRVHPRPRAGASDRRPHRGGGP